ncbi:YeeE/YedE family protein [Maricaulis sp.]|uniref:YeeE/YedE family protein n=1 Tax=unclassified Maricaulis TaxID=2632371 RepID=UPI001B021AD7|nr:YeeE/YedE family protein [Maricaulis sp.]MBO6797508.1 YeeE/YedE family protein [Maricaulis sp.]
MENFTPWSALAGGALIGLAAVILMGANGRIAGISGIVGGLLTRSQGDTAWRLWFVGGMVIAPLLVTLSTGNAPPFLMQADWWAVILGGLLVGVGTRLGSGCTSGHGVCGLSRLSLRSLAAVAMFMGAGMVTVTVLRLAMGG